ncbi:MAG: CPBP family intramembrane metalloprotease [Alphaproteobacteria bacterium]|nr:CPBP family intramembrane metalloprotease [Alphaproteobacteria bacterium]
MTGAVPPGLPPWVAVVVSILSVLLMGWILRALLRWRNGRAPVWGVVDGIIALCILFWGSGEALGVLSLFQEAPLHVDEPLPLWLAVTGTAIGGVLAAGWALLRAHHGEAFERLGLRWPVRPSAWALAIVGVPAFVLLSWGIVVALDWWGVPTEPQWMMTQVQSDPTAPGALLSVAFGVLAAPLIEEILFRGFLLTPLVRYTGRGIAVTLTAALFAAMHLSDPTSVLPLFVLGQALGWLRVYSRSLGPSVLMHALNNAVAFVLVIGWGV